METVNDIGSNVKNILWRVGGSQKAKKIKKNNNKSFNLKNLFSVVSWDKLGMELFLTTTHLILNVKPYQLKKMYAIIMPIDG